MAWFEILLSHLLLPATGLLILGYFGRSVVSQYLARDLERHKSQLSREFEGEKYQLTRDLERFRSELSAVLSERQARFSLMHEKRATVISELYGLIPAAEKAIARMTALMRMESPDKEEERKRKQEERKEAADAYNKAQDYFDRNRIFLGEKTARLSDEILTHMRKAFFDFDYSRGVYTQGKEDTAKWIAAWERITNEVPPLKESLTQEFRRILGITD